MSKLYFTNIREISALYYALHCNGYEYSVYERDTSLINRLESFRSQEKSTFFGFVKQTYCETYPYWPRASMLENASLFLNKEISSFNNFEKLKKKIMSASNIDAEQKNDEFWDWLAQYPNALAKIINSEEFGTYFAWESNWIAKQNEAYENEIQAVLTALEFCTNNYGDHIKSIKLILNPIKCVYSADYYLYDDIFVFCSGGFKAESVIHEFLHVYVHSFMEMFDFDNHTCKFPGIDGSYYLNGDESGIKNAFEEYIVRKLTDAFVNYEPPYDINSFISNIYNDLL